MRVGGGEIERETARETENKRMKNGGKRGEEYAHIPSEREREKE